MSTRRLAITAHSLLGLAVGLFASAAVTLNYNRWLWRKQLAQDAIEGFGEPVLLREAGALQVTVVATVLLALWVAGWWLLFNRPPRRRTVYRWLSLAALIAPAAALTWWRLSTFTIL